MWDLTCQKIITINQFAICNSVSYSYQIISLPHFSEIRKDSHISWLQLYTHIPHKSSTTDSIQPGYKFIRPTVYALHSATHSMCSLGNRVYRQTIQFKSNKFNIAQPVRFTEHGSGCFVFAQELQASNSPCHFPVKEFHRKMMTK